MVTLPPLTVDSAAGAGGAVPLILTPTPVPLWPLRLNAAVPADTALPPLIAKPASVLVLAVPVMETVSVRVMLAWWIFTPLKAVPE
jgi:hypothetical protein